MSSLHRLFAQTRHFALSFLRGWEVSKKLKGRVTRRVSFPSRNTACWARASVTLTAHIMSVGITAFERTPTPPLNPKQTCPFRTTLHHVGRANSARAVKEAKPMKIQPGDTSGLLRKERRQLALNLQLLLLHLPTLPPVRSSSGCRDANDDPERMGRMEFDQLRERMYVRT